MAEIKYLDLSGLSHYDGKIKSHISAAVEGGVTGLVSEITSIAVVGEEVVLTYKVVGDEVAKTITLPKADLKGLIGEVSDSESGLMIAADKTKLDGIAEGAQVNVVEGISLNGHAFEIGADKIASAEMTFDWEAEGSDSLVLKIGEIEIGKIDTTKFVKDGIVSEAELITIPDDEAATVDRPAGKYIKISWSGDAGTDPTYINVTDLVDIHNVIGDDVAAGELVKVHTEVTGSGTSMDPWKVSAKLDETALVAALDAKIGKDDVMLNDDYQTSIEEILNGDNQYKEISAEGWDVWFGLTDFSEFTTFEITDENGDVIWNNNGNSLSIHAVHNMDNVSDSEIKITSYGFGTQEDFLITVTPGSKFVFKHLKNNETSITIKSIENIQLNTQESISHLNETKAGKLEVEAALETKANITDLDYARELIYSNSNTITTMLGVLNEKIGKDDTMLQIAPADLPIDPEFYSFTNEYVLPIAEPDRKWKAVIWLNESNVNQTLYFENGFGEDSNIMNIGDATNICLVGNVQSIGIYKGADETGEYIGSGGIGGFNYTIRFSEACTGTIVFNYEPDKYNTEQSIQYLVYGKADNSSLDLKADKTEVESSLALKADKSEVETALDNKIGKDDLMLSVSNGSNYVELQYADSTTINGSAWDMIIDSSDSLKLELYNGNNELIWNYNGNLKTVYLTHNVLGVGEDQIKIFADSYTYITVTPNDTFVLKSLTTSLTEVSVKTLSGEYNTQDSLIHLNETKANVYEVNMSLDALNHNLRNVENYKIGVNDNMLTVYGDKVSTTNTVPPQQDGYLCRECTGSKWSFYAESAEPFDIDLLHYGPDEVIHSFTKDNSNSSKWVRYTNENGVLTIEMENAETQTMNIDLEFEWGDVYYTLATGTMRNVDMNITVEYYPADNLNTQESLTYLNNKLAAIDTHEVVTIAEIDALFA